MIQMRVGPLPTLPSCRLSLIPAYISPHTWERYEAHSCSSMAQGARMLPAEKSHSLTLSYPSLNLSST